jgi:hypothetical protein
MIILKLRLTPGQHEYEHRNILPRDLYRAACQLGSTNTDISSAMKEYICPVCNGQQKIGETERIYCPICNGTGWKDGIDPTEPEDPEHDNS